MTKTDTGRLVILAGPSCVGKSPLVKAFARFHPELAGKMQPLVLYNSRDPRPGESDRVDYYFQSRKYIESLKGNEQFVVMEVRGDLQAIDLHELNQTLRKGDVLFEGNPFIGKVLLTHPSPSQIKKLSIFMSPITKEEMLIIKASKQGASLPDRVKEIMKPKLVRRTKRQKGNLTQNDMEDIETRATSAYIELCDAHLYQYVIPNHDGEDSDHWNAPLNPVGDARLALEAFVELLKGNIPDRVERWPADLIF